MLRWLVRLTLVVLVTAGAGWSAASQQRRDAAPEAATGPQFTASASTSKHDRMDPAPYDPKGLRVRYRAVEPPTDRLLSNVSRDGRFFAAFIPTSRVRGPHARIETANLHLLRVLLI